MNRQAMNDQLRLATRLATSVTVGELTKNLATCADFVGASKFRALHYSMHAPGLGLHLHNIDERVQARITAEAVGKMDPIDDHLQKSSAPLCWDRATYDSVGQAQEWMTFADAAMPRGIAVSQHLPDGQRMYLGWCFAGSDVNPVDFGQKHAQLLQSFAAFAESSMRRLKTLAALPGVTGPLTTRELQCLFWASRGLSDDDTGLIAKISPSTVRKHIDNSVRKLGAINRTHAAVVATARGLLTDDLALL